MRVLHLSTTDITGGAGIAAKRLHDALQQQGVESFMLVQSKKSDDKFIYKNSNIPFINRLRSELDLFPFIKNIKYKHNFSPAWLPDSINRNVKKIKPDIVHLHWLNGGFIKIESLSKIKVPVLWSLHDMWPFTGGCHYDNECEKYRIDCVACPLLRNGSKLSEKIFTKKEKTYNAISNLNINGLSKWLAECAERSKLLHDKRIYNLPNCIDTEEFYPIDKHDAKKEFGIKSHSKVILFGGIAATQDKRKGFDLLKKAFLNSKENKNLTLAVFGNPGSKELVSNHLNIKYLGHITNINKLKIAYSTADVVVVPSRQENLSNVVLEALSCGTPVVAFNIGGMPDMIRHKENGYLAEPFQIQDLAKGIKYTIDSENSWKLSENARISILKFFNSGIVAKRYIEIYEEILKG